jgi:hypothetical protein
MRFRFMGGMMSEIIVSRLIVPAEHCKDFGYWVFYEYGRHSIPLLILDDREMGEIVRQYETTMRSKDESVEKA